MKTQRHKGAAWLLALAFMAPASAVLAQDVARSADEVSRMTREISQEIYSPYCPGKTLAMCPSANAGVARMDIQKMASEGMEKDAIKAELIERFGEDFEVVEPPAEDNAKLLGSIVVGLILAVLAVVALARRRMAGDGHVADEDGPSSSMEPIDDEDGYLDELRDDYLS
ncbi:hypothetical protein DV096_07140 [Bradymonadaceae bacterium TMQ3]|uniref:Cytochrome c-type biogenesis protein n=1 Tax=Lujinxingia sediminis TaxID=2480984 RepID=A0ABY0CTD7_9DELT|nr:cytochrome c-type biogenesis protein CcmH [Lujinxingia sediminis]RDV38581.1 hypothetical protein DV096_07140 [Bradymonadaceae bacterium TMQ3]RVU44870.1 hypothetical protein EA187_10055 [Lujinxingia sediminis]TXC76649.1 hypothetical protein FRC91_07930 [Bradymonadales bacterium TMQ1]